MEEHARAQDCFDEALRLARAIGDVHSEIFALLGRGRAYNEQQSFEQAEDDLNTALALTETTDPCQLKADVLIELGNVYTNMRRWHAATLHYQHVIELASQTFMTTRYRAREGLAYVQMARQRKGRTRWSIACLFFAALALGTISYSVVASRRSRTTEETEQLVPLTASPPPLPTRRLAYLQAVLHQPHEVADTIRQMYLDVARRLDKDRLRNRTELYSSVGALEHILEGHELGNPEDAIRMDLTRHFKRNDWSWPNSFDAWREHFDEHPMPVLFKTDDQKRTEE